MIRILFVAVGGMIGTILRYLLSGLTYRAVNDVFPWGTLAVNLTGSLLIGFLWGMLDRIILSPNLKTFIFMGFLGGFTTFSAYSLETFNLLRAGEIKLALLNFSLNNFLGIGLVFTGFFLSHTMIGIFK